MNENKPENEPSVQAATSRRGGEGTKRNNAKGGKKTGKAQGKGIIFGDKVVHH